MSNIYQTPATYITDLLISKLASGIWDQDATAVSCGMKGKKRNDHPSNLNGPQKGSYSCFDTIRKRESSL